MLNSLHKGSVGFGSGLYLGHSQRRVLNPLCCLGNVPPGTVEWWTSLYSDQPVSLLLRTSSKTWHFLQVLPYFSLIVVSALLETLKPQPMFTGGLQRVHWNWLGFSSEMQWELWDLIDTHVLFQFTVYPVNSVYPQVHSMSGHNSRSIKAAPDHSI